MSTINFQDAHRKLRDSDQAFEAKLQAIVAADTRYQEAVANRGGTMTSSLTDDAQAAANNVIRQRDRARAKIARPVAEAALPELLRMKAEAVAAAREWEKKHQALANCENQLNGVLARAGQPLVTRLTGQHTADPREFLARLETHAALAAVRPVLQPLAPPNFSEVADATGPLVAIVAARA